MIVIGIGSPWGVAYHFTLRWTALERHPLWLAARLPMIGAENMRIVPAEAKPVGTSLIYFL